MQIANSLLFENEQETQEGSGSEFYYFMVVHKKNTIFLFEYFGTSVVEDDVKFSDDSEEIHVNEDVYVDNSNDVHVDNSNDVQFMLILLMMLMLIMIMGIFIMIMKAIQ